MVAVKVESLVVLKVEFSADSKVYLLEASMVQFSVDLKVASKVA
jgi:hypothetical protein